MSYFSALRFSGLAVAISVSSSLLFLSACTVEPLNASRGTASLSSTTQNLLASTDVSPVRTRVGQQVRNALLFAMNGGQLQPGGPYSVDLSVSPTTSELLVQVDSLAPTAAQVSITARYNLVEQATGITKSTGTRTAVASYDKTSQSFANERAQRDAENRAAKDVAQQLRLSIAQSLAAL